MYALLALIAAAAAAAAAGDGSYNKTILITGANRGIGKELSRIFLQEGHRVLMACRSPARCTEAAEELMEDIPGSVVDVLTVDVTDGFSIEHLADVVADRYDEEIDVLINNAGIFMERYYNQSEWRKGWLYHTVRTNYWGPVMVTLALSPYLKPGGQVLQVSSGFSKRRFLVDTRYKDCIDAAEDFDELSKCPVFRPNSTMAGEEGPAYKISKVMLNKATEFLARLPLLANRSISVNAGNPGTTETRMAPTANQTALEGAENLALVVRTGLDRTDLSYTEQFVDKDGSYLDW